MALSQNMSIPRHELILGFNDYQLFPRVCLYTSLWVEADGSSVVTLNLQQRILVVVVGSGLYLLPIAEQGELIHESSNLLHG